MPREAGHPVNTCVRNRVEGLDVSIVCSLESRQQYARSSESGNPEQNGQPFNVAPKFPVETALAPAGAGMSGVRVGRFLWKATTML